jgi:hypothetical protein
MFITSTRPDPPLHSVASIGTVVMRRSVFDSVVEPSCFRVDDGFVCRTGFPTPSTKWKTWTCGSVASCLDFSAVFVAKGPRRASVERLSRPLLVRAARVVLRSPHCRSGVCDLPYGESTRGAARCGPGDAAFDQVASAALDSDPFEHRRWSLQTWWQFTTCCMASTSLRGRGRNHGVLFEVPLR